MAVKKKVEMAPLPKKKSKTPFNLRGRSTGRGIKKSNLKPLKSNRALPPQK